MSRAGALARKIVRRQYFYGWNIVGLGFLASFAHTTEISSVLGVFMKPMGSVLGVGRGAMAGVQTILRLVEAGMAPIVGPLVDRGWGRRMMVVGPIFAALGFFAVSQVNELWQLYALKAFVTGVGISGASYIVVRASVVKWFDKKRGRALAVAGMGGAVGGMIMVPVIAWVVSTWGWRWGWVGVGLFILLVIPIPAAIFMRRQPEDMGLRPDGEPPLPEVISPPALQTPRGVRREMPLPGEDYWTAGEAMRTRTFWFLIATFGTAHIFMQAINLHLIPYLEDQGYTVGLAALAISFRSAITMVSAIPWGLASERFNLLHLASLKNLMYALGISIIWLYPVNAFYIFLAVGIYGFAMGGTMVTETMLYAKYYGRQGIGAVRGSAAPFLEGVSAASPFLVGIIYDLTGGYSVSFMVIIAGMLMSAVMVQFCTAPRHRASLA